MEFRKNNSPEKYQRIITKRR